MDLKTTLILVVLLAAAVGAYLFTRGGDKNDSGDDTQQRVEPRGDNDPPLISKAELGPTLKRIAFDYGEDGIKVELLRENGRWWVNKPHRFPADPVSIQTLFKALGDMTVKPAEEHVSGLVRDSSGLILEHTAEAYDIKLWFNQRLGAGRAVITAQRRDRITHHNTQDTLADLFEQLDTGAFFAKKITPPLVPEISRIEIMTGSEQSVLTQRDGRWWIGDTQPAERALELNLEGYQSIADYFKLFGAIELKQQHAYEKSAGPGVFGLDTPTIAVRFIPEDADADAGWTLRVGARTATNPPLRYLSYGRTGDPHPAVFTVDEKLALLFGQQATNFRDPRIMTTLPRQAASIRIEQPGKNIQPIEIRFASDGTITATSLRGDKGEFGGIGFPVDRAACLALVNDLSTARASAFIPQEPIPRPIARRITITPRLGDSPEVIELVEDPASTADKPTVLVRRGDEPVLLRVERSVVAALLDPATLQAKTEP